MSVWRRNGTISNTTDGTTNVNGYAVRAFAIKKDTTKCTVHGARWLPCTILCSVYHALQCAACSL